MDPEFLLGYFARATALLNNTMYEDAINDFDEVIELDESFSEAWLYRAFSRYKLYKFGSESFEVATYLNPPTQAFEGSELYEDQKEKICSDFSTALELGGDVDSSIVEILEKVCH